MNNTPLYIKCKTYDFKEVLKHKGYVYFDKGLYNVNIIGVRSNNNATNKFDDCLVLEYKDNHGPVRHVYNITTDPGKTYLNRPTNRKGTAILVPDQYRGVYKLDLHNGKYKALCQRLGPVKVYRDGDKNDVYYYNPASIELGNFGINIHRADARWTRETIDNYSAGCQVFNNPVEFNEFIKILETSAKLYGNKFTYTLLDEKDLDLY